MPSESTIGYGGEVVIGNKKLSNLRTTNPKPVAITCGDLHFSIRKPPCRAESDWLAVQHGYCQQLEALRDRLQVPILCTGDICEWDSPPELINWLLIHLPNNIHAIPGNHDTPNHNLMQIERSAFWTLIASGRIHYLGPTDITGFPGMVVHPYPDCNVIGERPNRPPMDGRVRVALLHAYCWSEGHSFPGCPPERHVTQWMKRFPDFDVLVFGDNHSGFVGMDHLGRGPRVFNGGTFMRRRSDEIDYRPMVGIIYADGSVAPHYLDTSRDEFITVDESLIIDEVGLDSAELIKTMRDLGDKLFSYTDALKAWCMKHHVPPTVVMDIQKHLRKRP